MLFISKQGHVNAERVIVKIYSSIERGPMEHVNGIVVHQTGGATVSSTFNSYSNTAHVPNGAHFHRMTNHIGKLQSRCITTLTARPQTSERHGARTKPVQRHSIAMNPGRHFRTATRPTRTR